MKGIRAQPPLRRPKAVTALNAGPVGLPHAFVSARPATHVVTLKFTNRRFSGPLALACSNCAF